VTSSSGSGASSAEPVAAGNGSMTILPGEKLSRVAAGPAAGGEATVEDEELTPFDAETGETADVEGPDDAEGEAGRRRRRRRGGRGRGRGRGRDGEPTTAEGGAADGDLDEDEAEDEVAPAPRGPRTTPFGSVWDSQLGTPAARGPVAPLGDDEDFEEPEIPEYLIAERNRSRSGQGGRGGGPVGGRGGRRGA